MSPSVYGMTCCGCVATVKRVVAGLPGVRNVEVYLQDARAEVEYDAAVTAAERIVEAVSNAGFDADAG